MTPPVEPMRLLTAASSSSSLSLSSLSDAAAERSADVGAVARAESSPDRDVASNGCPKPATLITAFARTDFGANGDSFPDDGTNHAAVAPSIAGAITCAFADSIACAVGVAQSSADSGPGILSALAGAGAGAGAAATATPSNHERF